MRERAGERPVVLAIDDAHALDPVSAALVLHLATTATAFVIATVRTGEQNPDAIVALWKDGAARRLELAPLDDASVVALAEGGFGGPVEQAVHRWLVESSGGNALFVRELVRGAVEGGALSFDRGLWRLSGTPRVSGSLVELVTARMQGMGGREREPLELLALGEPLRIGELAALTSDEAAQAAEAAGMIAADGAEVRVAHPLYAEVVRAGLQSLRARALRLRLADTLQARVPITPGDALRIARLRLDAGADLDPEVALVAAEAALHAGDPDFAEELALAAGGGVEATMLRARAHAARRRFEEAEVILAGLEGRIESPDLAGEYLHLRAIAVLYWGLLRLDEGQALFERARSWFADPEWHHRLELLSPDEGFMRGARDTQRALADPELDPALRRALEPQYAISLFFTGRTREAYALTQRIRPAVPLREASDTMALGIWSIVCLESGEDWSAFEADLEQLVRDAIRADDHPAAGIGARGLAGLRFHAGRYADAARWLAEAEAQLERSDAMGMFAVVHAIQVGVAYATGDHEGAAAALTRMRASLGGRPPLVPQLPYVTRAEGWGALARGDAIGAQQLLLDAAARNANPNFKGHLLYEAMRAGARADALAAEQEALAERCDSRLVRAYAAHTSALAAADGDALLAAAEELAAIGALRYAMEAAADASRACRDVRKQDGARRALVRAEELYDEGPPPHVEDVGGGVEALTPREAQLVELAARGLTSAEIADQLVLSRRTVESHLYHAMQKLGVSDRRELPRIDARAAERERTRSARR
jgi:DNA-binding NarL/FixJ family response regulator